MCWILNSGDLCVSCSCSFIYLFISVNIVLILFFVNNISSNSINNFGVIITISVSYFSIEMCEKGGLSLKIPTPKCVHVENV